jgi:hypothetical protein
MEPEELDPTLLIDRFVTEVGRRQAWSFLGIHDPKSSREIRLYIDATCSLSSVAGEFEQDDAGLIHALERLNGLTLTEVVVLPEALFLKLGAESLQIESRGNDLITHSPWWIAATN